MIKESDEQSRENESPVYVNSCLKEQLDSKMVDTAFSVRTLYEGLQMAAETYGDLNFLGKITQDGKIEYLKYAEARDMAEEVAHFICDNTEVPSPIVGICSENRPEWIVAEHASYFFSGMNCPMYPSFGWGAMKHILNETKMEIVFISQKNLEKLISGLMSEEKNSDAKKAQVHLPGLFIVFDKHVSAEHVAVLEKRKSKVALFWDIVQKYKKSETSTEGGDNSERPQSSGEKNTADKNSGKTAAKDKEKKKHPKFVCPGPETIATVCYTSGTTGTPKGAMLTHRNFISVAGSFLHLSDANKFFPLDDNSRYLSFLPLAHVFERVVESTLLMSRCSIIYYSGNPKQLQKDFEAAKPHYMVGVPRVFNSVKQAIETKAEEKGRVANAVFRASVAMCKVFKNSLVRELFGKTVFRAVRRSFGGEIRCMLSGSAPISEETAEFFEAVFNCPFFEGYGQTETAAGNITTELGTNEKGVIGIPFPCNRVKLLSRPEYGADVKDGRGEILMQGPSIFLGYFKQDALTRDVFYGAEKDADIYNSNGNKWIKTGDLGEITEQGNLRIIGRCKEIFKLSQGEYIVPEKIETHFMSRGIESVEDFTVIGFTNKDYVLAICTVKSREEADRKRVEEAVQKEGEKLVAEGELIKIEIPKKIIFTDQPFTIDNGLLTPSGKKVRKNIMEKYKEEISDGYRTA